MSITFNTQPRDSDFDTEHQYFRRIEPLQSHTNVPTEFRYPFILPPNDHQPSGTINISRMGDIIHNFYIQATIPAIRTLSKPDAQKILSRFWLSQRLKQRLRHLARASKIRAELRHRVRTANLHTELIYLPDIGYKYFEGMEHWKSSLK